MPHGTFTLGSDHMMEPVLENGDATIGNGNHHGKSNGDKKPRFFLAMPTEPSSTTALTHSMPSRPSCTSLSSMPSPLATLPSSASSASFSSPLLERQDTCISLTGFMENAAKPTKPPMSKLNIIKCVILFLLTAAFLVMFISSGEHEKRWHHIAVSKTHSGSVSITHPRTQCVLAMSLMGPLTDHKKSSHSKNNITVIIDAGLENKTRTWTFGLKDDEEKNKTHGVSHGGSHGKQDEEITVSWKASFDDCDEHHPFEVTFISTTDKYVALSYHYTTINNEASHQVIYAAVVLCGVYVLIVFELVHRTLAAMLGSLAALAVLAMLNEKPSLDKVIQWVDEETLSLLFGMMVLVAIFTETGVFDYCALWGYKLSRGHIWPLLTILCLFSAIVSAFLDNVTTVLLLTPITIRLCQVVRLEPKYVLIAEVLFSNIGGTATAVGDPPNVIIVSNSDISDAGIDFAKFTLHMFLGIIFVTVAGYGMLRWQFRNLDDILVKDPAEIIGIRREIDIWKKATTKVTPASREERNVRAVLQHKVAALENNLNKKLKRKKKYKVKDFQATLIDLEKKYKITDMPLLIKSACVLAVVILLFFLHSFIEGLHLSLGWISILGAVTLLVLADMHDLEAVFEKVEWATLLFFAALFVMMEALTELGLIDFIGAQTSNLIQEVPSSSRLAVALIIILWVSALASSFIDNIPYTTAMVPVVLKLAEDPSLNLPLEPMVWALAFGACLGGNGTLIGASANVVCAGIAEQHGYGFSFKDFFKLGFPMMLVTTFIAMLYLMIMHVGIEWNGI